MASFWLNFSVAVAILAWLAHRASIVGVFEALAEAVGLVNFQTYIDWRDGYHPRHPSLFSQPLHAILEPALATALETPSESSRRRALRRLVTHHGHGVFTVPLLSASFCTMLAEEADAFARSEHAAATPSTSMHDYGIILGHAGLQGLDALMASLRDELLALLTPVLFQWIADESDEKPEEDAAAASAYQRILDNAGISHRHQHDGQQQQPAFADHHAFVVSYNSSEMAGLDMHHDASDITLNVCLLRQHASESGGERANSGMPSEPAAIAGDLRFCGRVGDRAHRKRTVTLEHRVGTAVIHLGTHRHGATDVAEGAIRRNLILWARFRREQHGRGALDLERSTEEAGANSFAIRSHRRSVHELAPDLECLSWTHDDDYTEYAPLPEAALRARAKLEEAEAKRREVREIARRRLPRAHANPAPVSSLQLKPAVGTTSCLSCHRWWS